MEWFIEIIYFKSMREGENKISKFRHKKFLNTYTLMYFLCNDTKNYKILDMCFTLVVYGSSLYFL